SDVDPPTIPTRRLPPRRGCDPPADGVAEVDGEEPPHAAASPPLARITPPASAPRSTSRRELPAPGAPRADAPLPACLPPRLAITPPPAGAEPPGNLRVGQGGAEPVPVTPDHASAQLDRPGRLVERHRLRAQQRCPRADAQQRRLFRIRGDRLDVVV